MAYQLPHTIKNSLGETLTFKQLIKDQNGEKLFVDNEVQPGFGPPMHTHFLQDEILTVVQGKMGYQVLGQQERFAYAGETVAFKAGVAHRFWNAGEDVLKCEGYITPANNIVFFLSAIFAAQVKTASLRPDFFDGAFLLHRYRSEFDMNEIPGFVKKVIMPIVYQLGKLLGKYQHFKNAPEPVQKKEKQILFSRSSNLTLTA